MIKKISYDEFRSLRGLSAEAPEEERLFFDAVIDGRFCDAARWADKMSDDAALGVLIGIYHFGTDIRVYAYWVARLLEEESAKNHYWAAMQFTVFAPEFDGGFYVSLFHLRRAIEMDPENVECKRAAFSIYGTVYEKAFPRSEAIALGREVMKTDNTGLVKSKTELMESLEREGKSSSCVIPYDDLMSDFEPSARPTNMSEGQRDFIEMLLEARFADAAKLGGIIGDEDVFGALAVFPALKCDMFAYGYWVCRLLQKENARNHYRVARQLLMNTWGMPGAYAVSRFHARKAAELDPDNAEYQRLVAELSAEMPENVPLPQATDGAKPESPD